jgi:hypothetical protein
MEFSVGRRSATRLAVATLVSLVAVFMGLLPGAAAAAGSQEASPEAEPRVPCGAGQCLIMYSNTNLQGDQFHLDDTSANGCVSAPLIGQPVRSYDNRNSRLEGYFYAGSNCDGGAIQTVTYGSYDSDIGTAYSFKIACVSCRSEGDRG